MKLPLPIAGWCLGILWIAFIYFMGSPRFGRQGTQSWIDRAAMYPRLQAFLNRHHGRFRAGFHYVEYVTLTLLLYWSFNFGSWKWSDMRGAIAYLISCLCAYLDELHQSRTPGRCFRPIDFLHSLLGSTLALGAIRLSIWKC